MDLVESRRAKSVLRGQLGAQGPEHGMNNQPGLEMSDSLVMNAQAECSLERKTGSEGKRKRKRESVRGRNGTREDVRLGELPTAEFVAKAKEGVTRESLG